MKKAFVIVIVIFLTVFTGFFISLAYSQCVVGEKIKYAEEINDPRTKSTEETIKTINLLNNMSLKEEQLEVIIRHAREIEQTRKDAYAQFSLSAGKMYRLERRIQQQVESGRTVLDKDLADEYTKMKRQRDRLFFRLNDKIKEGIGATEAVMGKFQLLAIDAYIPCIIPIVKDGFIGGVGKVPVFTSFLMRSRKIRAERYEIDKERLINSKIEDLKSKLCPCKKLYDAAVVREEMAKSLEQARNLDDVDFKLRVDKMSEELEQKIILEGPELSRQDKIQRFLLSGRSIPVLEEKLRRKRKQ